MILTLLLFIPLIGAILTLLMKKQSVSVVTMVAEVLVAAYSVVPFLRGNGFRFIENAQWLNLQIFDVRWHLGVDGISYALVLLTILVALTAVLVSSKEITQKKELHLALLLTLTTAIIGVFVALDMVIFFVFWELVLVLMFLLILLWGHANRKYAAMRLLVFTGIGSLALLLAIILLAWYGGSLSILDIAQSNIPVTAQYIVMGLLLFAFFIKMPIVPFHTWLPDAHVEAPTAGSMLLAGLMLKMGAYGLLRLGIMPLHDMSAKFSHFLFIMGTLTILYGAFVCLGQMNLKKLIAYSSVNHMGIVLLGLATGSSLGIAGAVFAMISHGLLSALLFGLAGTVHQQLGTYDLHALKGLVTRMPGVAWTMVVAGLGSLGLPTMSGFIAEFIVFLAAAITFGLWGLLPIVGVLFTASYIIRLFSTTIFGKGRELVSERGISMLPYRLLLAGSFALGLFPMLVLVLL